MTQAINYSHISWAADTIWAIKIIIGYALNFKIWNNHQTLKELASICTKNYILKPVFHNFLKGQKVHSNALIRVLIKGTIMVQIFRFLINLFNGIPPFVHCMCMLMYISIASILTFERIRQWPVTDIGDWPLVNESSKIWQTSRKWIVAKWNKADSH